MAAIVLESSARLNASVRPLFYEDVSKRKVRPLGSCVLVTIDNTKFVLTAAHVMRKDSFRNEFHDVPVVLYTPTGRAISFERWEPVFTGTTGGGTDIDVAFVRLEDNASSALEGCAFLGQDERELNHNDDRSRDSFYLIVGYPGSRKLTKIWQGLIKQFSFSIATYPAREELHQKINRSRKDHILLEYSDNKVTHNGLKRKMPKVQGMSGGGVFHVDRQTRKARLVGIVSEHHAKSEVIVAKRIDSFIMIATLFNTFPELAALIKTKPSKDTKTTKAV